MNNPKRESLEPPQAIDVLIFIKEEVLGSLWRLPAHHIFTGGLIVAVTLYCASVVGALLMPLLKFVAVGSLVAFTVVALIKFFRD